MVKNSSITIWYNNGQKMIEGIYKDDQRDGLETTWWDNGQKRVEDHLNQKDTNDDS